MSEHEPHEILEYPKELQSKIDALEPVDRTDEKIDELKREYLQNIQNRLLAGSTESSLPITIEKILQKVQLEKMDDFLSRCPSGDELYNEYVQFLTKFLKEGNHPAHNYAKFVEMIFNDFLPPSEGWIYEIK